MELGPAGANKEKITERIQYFKERPLLQLQHIIPHWAFGKDIDEIRDQEIHPLRQSRYVLRILDLKKLIKCANFGEVNPTVLFTGEPLNDGRVSRILDRWEKHEFIDPPTIYVKKEHILFSDGRHRTKVAYLLGASEIPVAVETNDLPILGCLFRADY